MKNNDTRRKALPTIIVPRTNLCACIARGSTVEQQLTLGAQVDSLRRFCDLQRLDHGEGDRIFVDSGTSTSIPFLQREIVRQALHALADAGGQQLVLTRLDRAFRNAEERYTSLRLLNEAGVIVHFTEQQIPQPTSAFGKMQLGMLGLVAEWEKDLRAERQFEAGVIQRKLGHKCGQNAPYGWDAALDPSGRKTKGGAPGYILVENAEQQEVLREILRRHDDGESDGYIAQVLNEARIPTAKAGQMIKYRGVVKEASGKWKAATVYSVRSFARSESFAFLNADPSIQ